tara:strand:- start:561 stop:980 length:420 start_codon:yes stop_codon:yes gene_type:complete
MKNSNRNMETKDKEYNFKRRRAIECKFVEKSKSNPGYLKYLVTIVELDGTEHTQPCYGKDMQSALSRLINIERTRKIEKRLGAGWFFLAWCIVMGWPAFMMEDTNQPWWLLYSFGSIFALVGLGGMWYQYIDKGDERIR